MVVELDDAIGSSKAELEELGTAQKVWDMSLPPSSWPCLAWSGCR